MPGRVLIIDDLATNRIILKVKLSAAYYDVAQAASVDDACARLPDLRPDMILLSARQGEEGETGSCADQSSANARTSALSDSIHRLQLSTDDAVATPVVVLLNSDTAEDRVRALKAGAEDVLCRPLDEQILLARLRNLMRQRLSDQELRHHSLTAQALGFAEDQGCFDLLGNIGLIAQQKQTARVLQSRLASHVHHSLRMVSAEEIMCAVVPDPAMGATPVPDLFLLQLAEGQGQDGLRLLAELRADPVTRNCPVVAVMPEWDTTLASNLLDLGAGDVIVIDTETEEMALRIDKQLEQKRNSDRLRDRLKDGLQAAVIDPLTGLYNRRYALSYLRCLMETQGSEAGSFAVMVADLDYFKQVNDRFGHAAGDAVLTHVAKLLQGHMRKDDLVARIGGEEFLIIVPGTTQDQAREIATQLCHLVRDTPIALPGQRAPARVTISIGLALADASETRTDDLLDLADRALYRSKAEGRNTVCAA
ncbi:diguanylate cyclase [Roseovarius sp. 2305UL8-3]|uniref:diguanylate cyclase n=1 Tax=Roseovarius conchicola TaxID=3121636 RepID=UPI003526F7AC